MAGGRLSLRVQHPLHRSRTLSAECIVHWDTACHGLVRNSELAALINLMQSHSAVGCSIFLSTSSFMVCLLFHILRESKSQLAPSPQALLVR